MRTHRDARRVIDALRRKATSARQIGNRAEADTFDAKAVELEEMHGLNLDPADNVLTAAKMEAIEAMVAREMRATSGWWQV